jgi:DNA-binding Lrp family transcriptional regulator
MYPTRVVLLFTVVLLFGATALAQRPGPQFWRKDTCEPFEPRTFLERLERIQGAVVIKGFTRITTIDVRGVRIDAVEMRKMGDRNYEKGIVISLREEGEKPIENRAFVDYGELDPLLNAIDVVSRVDETQTKFPGFEARYRTAGDFEISVFRQTRSGAAVSLTVGLCDLVTQTMTLDDLAKVKALIQEAKTRLDESR